MVFGTIKYMNLVREYLVKKKIEDLAIPSNVREGNEIIKDFGVEIFQEGDDYIIAKVRGGTPRSVRLFISDGVLSWKCTCTNNPDIFCKHCVALANVLKS